MKKIFYLMACTAIAGLTFTSCGDDEVDGGINNTDVREAKTEDLASFYEIDPTPLTIEENGSTVNKNITELEITEDEHVIFTFEELPLPAPATRGAAKKSWRMYKFTKDGDTYKIIGFGTMLITKDGETYLIELRPSKGDPATTHGKYSRKNRDKLTKKLSLTWVVDRYRVVVTTKSGTNAGTGWKSLAGGGCNFQELIDYANEQHNAGIKANLGKKQIVEGITFTGEGTFLINYKNTTEQDVGNWKWRSTNNNGGTVDYLWRDPDTMGNDFLGDFGGTAIIEFKDGKCRLTLVGQVDREVEVKIDFDLK